MDLLVKNIGTLYTPSEGQPYGHFTEMKHVSVLCRDGLIGHIFSRDEDIPGEHHIRTVVDAGGMTLLPGFVDAHTHPVFSKTREKEFVMRLEGRSYEEIAAAGGGIRNSARDFRSTGKEAIRQITRSRLDTFTAYGTTTIEAKSGYGLSTQDEIKALEIIQELNTDTGPEMVPTFLGAHEIPDEYRDNRNGYIDLIINEMIPLVAGRKLAKYCDVFCEKGVFTVAESKRILDAAGKNGLEARIHADELSAFGGAELAAEIGAASADHLVMISDKAIEAMALRRVIPVLLPVTTFFLRKDRYAPARKMIEAGCDVAVATDFNPGSSMTQNMQLVWSVAALKLGMLPGELLWATTLIPAKSLGISDRVGSLQPGKQADMVLLDIPNLDYLPYHIGINHAKLTVKKGNVIYEDLNGKNI